VQIAGEVKDFNQRISSSAKKSRNGCLHPQYALSAGSMAIEDAGLKITKRMPIASA